MKDIDYDKMGCCVKCHTNMLEEKMINNVVHYVFNKDKTTVVFRLNDSSTMKVAMCKRCKTNLNPNQYDYIMGSVFRGWIYGGKTPAIR